MPTDIIETKRGTIIPSEGFSERICIGKVNIPVEIDGEDYEKTVIVNHALMAEKRTEFAIRAISPILHMPDSEFDDNEFRNVIVELFSDGKPTCSTFEMPIYSNLKNKIGEMIANGTIVFREHGSVFLMRPLIVRIKKEKTKNNFDCYTFD